MTSEICCFPSCQLFPSRASIQGFVDDYFDLNAPSSFMLTALKVISYVTPIILIVLAAQAFLWCTESCAPSPLAGRVVQQLSSVPLDPNILAVLNTVPAFADYRIGQGTPYPNTNLTAVTVRPANLFFDALLGPNCTTKPGSGSFSRSRISPRCRNSTNMSMKPNYAVKNEIFFYGQAEDVVVFMHKAHSGGIRSEDGSSNLVSDLADLYGNATYRISGGRNPVDLVSQKIYSAPLLPLEFYRALKDAMDMDRIVILPGNDSAPLKLSALNTPNCRAFITRFTSIRKNMGLQIHQEWNGLSNLSLYQIGALVVKSEDFRIFLDANGKIRERQPGEQDAIRLINACGIRGIGATPSPMNQPIMTQTFRTALQAAESGFVIFPAVGMGIWGGDPALYWRVLFGCRCCLGRAGGKNLCQPRPPSHKTWAVYGIRRTMSSKLS